MAGGGADGRGNGGEEKTERKSEPGAPNDPLMGDNLINSEDLETLGYGSVW